MCNISCDLLCLMLLCYWTYFFLWQVKLQYFSLIKTGTSLTLSCDSLILMISYIFLLIGLKIKSVSSLLGVIIFFQVIFQGKRSPTLLLLVQPTPLSNNKFHQQIHVCQVSKSVRSSLSNRHAGPRRRQSCRWAEGSGLRWNGSRRWI